MQKEHVLYALTGLATDAAMIDQEYLAEFLIILANSDPILNKLAKYLDESDEDELVQLLIEKRIKEEQRAK